MRGCGVFSTENNLLSYGLASANLFACVRVCTGGWFDRAIFFVVVVVVVPELTQILRKTKTLVQSFRKKSETAL